MTGASIPLLLLFVAYALCTPLFTSVPTTDVTVHTGVNLTAFCAAIGSGTVSVVVQVSICGAGFANVASGSGSATWTQALGSSYNCALIQCQASDIDATITSNPISVIIEHGVGDTIDGACADICDTVRFKATSSGSIHFSNFYVARPTVNFLFLHYGNNVTIDMGSIATFNVSNWVGQGDENGGVYPAGQFNYELSGKSLIVQRFEMHGTTVMRATPRGYLKSATTISITDCVRYSLSGIVPTAPVGMLYSCSL